MCTYMKTIKINQMLVNIPYMNPMGKGKRSRFMWTFCQSFKEKVEVCPKNVIPCSLLNLELLWMGDIRKVKVYLLSLRHMGGTSQLVGSPKIP